MDIRLDGRVAIVTGSARRIGKSIARELAAAGAAVMINSRSDTEAARNTAQEIIDAGGRAAWCVADVTREDDVERLVAETLSAFGRIDILVNNAAVRPNAPLEKVSVESWRETIAVVLDGAFLCSRACSPHIKAGGNGRVINIGGAGAHKGVANRSHVSTAKAGLVGFTRSLAVEFASNATANCVVPGVIEDENDDSATMDARRKRMPIDNVPVGRPGRPSDVAGVVTFLCSDAGAYLTGQTVHVSGGLVFP